MKKIFLLLCVAALAFSACSDDYMEKVNTDDSKVSKLDPNGQLTTALLQTYGDISLMDTYRNYITGFTQHLAGGWNVSRYAGSVYYENDFTRRIWDRYYVLAIKNLADAIHNSADKPNLNAALRIHRVYLSAILADIYGDVPCMEAGLGFISGINQPKYDTVEEIYNFFFTELEACEKQLGTGTDRIKGDVTSLNGEVAKWKKYANSLRMRYAMRISGIAETKARAEFEKAVKAAGGYITSSDDDAYVKYSDSPYTFYDGANEYDFRTNALSEILYGQDSQAPTMVCSKLFYQLKNTNDPRLHRICRYYYNIKRSLIKPDKEQNIDLTDDVLAYFKSVNRDEMPCNPGAAWYDNWVDVIKAEDIPTLAKWAAIDPSVYDDADYRARATRPCLNIDFEMPTNPGILMTYAEVEFLLAEARANNWDVGGTPESHYEAGVRASMQMLNKYYLTSNKITDDEINAFITANPLGDKAVEVINTQAWILHLTNPSEAWANMRRSDYPAILDRTRLKKFPSDGFNSNDPDGNWAMPTRLYYPESERENNPVNLKAAVDRMDGVDNWHKRLWWDTKDINLQATYSQPYNSDNFGYQN
jgi:hypothetical protein